MNYLKRNILIFIFLVTMINVMAQDAELLPIIVEAESGDLGSNIEEQTEGDVISITAAVDFAGQSSPENENSIASYQVTFSNSGSYQLFARMRVGAGGYNDDSFFGGNGFIPTGETATSNWLMINGLAGAGFAGDIEVVDEMGIVGSEIWKWVNLSKNFYQNSEDVFKVEEDNLVQTFQIGAREDGLAFDKFVFARSDLYFTVDMLDQGLPGSITIPEPDSSKFYSGPAIAIESPKFLGNAKSKTDVNFASLWNQLTPGNEGKWASIAGSIDTTKWNWSALDDLYNYAKSNNIIFKEHTLIWGGQQPSWINNLGQEDQLKYIEIWMRQVGQRYPDMDMVDVVNEALPNHNPPDGKNNRANYKEALGGDGTTGWDWVIKSFELARKCMPAETKLLLNDYGIINSNAATTTYLKIINLLIERDLIDGIGVQGHRFELESVGVNTIKNNLDRLGETGLPVYMSEVDFGNLRNEGTPDDEQQLELYKKIFPVLWEHPYVHGITLWGYIENQMWQSSCYLALTDGEWRPALDWIANYVADNPGEIVTVDPNTTVDRYNNLSLVQNYPNPFSSSTTISFNVAQKEMVNLDVYNSTGQHVTSLVKGVMQPGNHEVNWKAISNSGEPCGNGIYFYKLTVGNKQVSKKMLLLE